MSTLFGGSQPQANTSLFGNAAKPSPFGAPAATGSTGGSMFGGTQNQTSTGTGAFGASATQQQPLFGGANKSVFGQQTQQQPPAASTGGMFGQQQQAPQQAQQPQQSQFGQTTMATPQTQQQQPSLSSSLWSPGRAITGGRIPCCAFLVERY